MLASFLDKTALQKRAQDEKQRQLQQLPDSVRSWVVNLERDAQKQAATIRKDAARQAQPLESQAAAVQSTIDSLQAQFDTSQAWLSAIPPAAEPSEAQRHLAVKTLWPDRIQKARDELASVRQQIADVQRRANIAVNDVRAGVNLQIDETVRLLPHIRIVIE